MKKVLVAMSGGVDSSVSAYLLKKQGYEVIGVTMCFGIRDIGNEKPRCCDVRAVEDAKKVCDKLKINHHVMDFSNQLQEDVIGNFISEYLQGRTPNPCVECNRHIKFDTLLKKALGMGFDYLATGHYAAVEKDGQDRFVLKKPLDRAKDQTYFLYTIRYEFLKNIIFPLSKYTKEEVRQIAHDAGLPVADKLQSQDICFVPGKNYREFIKENIGKMEPGPILDLNGNVLGEHKGVFLYTIGQREGLGISFRVPLYVLDIDPGKNQIVVGEKKDLAAKELIAGGMNLLSTDLSGDIFGKIRYTHKEALCRLDRLNDGFKISFEQSQSAIAPGQSVVLYKGDIVLGGGIIKEVLR